MEKDNNKTGEIKFKKNAPVLKIPQNCDALPAEEEKTVEFILEIE